MTYRELLQFLTNLERTNDVRLDERVIVYLKDTGDYYKGDIVEFDGDDIISPSSLFIMAEDWQ